MDAFLPTGLRRPVEPATAVAALRPARRPPWGLKPGPGSWCQRDLSRVPAPCATLDSTTRQPGNGTEAGMNLAEYDSNRQLADTKSGPVGYIDVGSGRPALFVHGVGTSGLLWRNVIGALKGERRCLALDLLLHGRTPARPGQDLSLAGFAKVVEDFCAALDLTGVDLVANDTGGAVAQIVAAHQVQRLATVTLTNCETPGNVPP